MNRKKHHFKRTLACLMVVIMTLSAVPMSGFVGLDLPQWSQLFAAKASAASSDYLTSGFCGEVTETTDGTQLSWVLDDAGTLTVTGTGRMAREAFKYDLRIKNVVIGEGVENIASYAFNECSNLVSITFSETISTIGEYSFNKCTALTEVIIPDSVKLLDDFAFANCSSINNLVLSSNLETIDRYAFSNCKKLTNVNFPNSLITIGADSFQGCALTGELIIPDSVVNIGYAAFTDNSNLISVSIGKGTKSFDINVFNRCSSLTSFSVSEENTVYSSDESGILFDKAATKIILVPAGITGEVTLPSTITDFTYKSVAECKKLTAINVEDGNSYYKSVDGIVYSADGKTLISCPMGRTESVTVAEGTEIIGDYAFNYCGSIQSIIFPQTLLETGDHSFFYCTSLTGVVLPDKLQRIGKDSFACCEKIGNITFPESLIEISSDAFVSCNFSGELVIPDGVVSIGSGAFRLNNITSAYIGSGVKSFNSSAFTYCNKLASISVSENNMEYVSHDGIVYDKNETSIIIVPPAIKGEITVPASIESINKSVFNLCQYLTDIHIESGNPNYQSFDGIIYSADGKTVIYCPRGKSGTVVVHDSTESIGNNAFNGCSKVNEVTLPDSVITIGSGAFYYCGLKTIKMSDSLEEIGNQAFYQSRLTSVELPDSFKSFTTDPMPYTFAYTPFLQSINIPPLITNLQDILYESSLPELVLPKTLQTISYLNCPKLKTLTFENRYCKYTNKTAPKVAEGCTVRAYCGSPGHELAVKRLLNFESLGHTYLGWYTVTPATYEAEGIERRDCAYCDGYEERVIPKLQKDVFTATFVADGEKIATVDFPKGSAEIEEPAVPAKDRYIGEWEDYTLSDSNLTINAVYTLIKSENASDIHTSSDVVHYTDVDDVLFKLRAWSDAKVVKSTVSKSVPLDIVLVVDQSGSMDETLGSSTKKIDALKNTAKEFINTVFENAKMTGADHRISLVGFGLSGDYKGFEKNENTELLTSERGIVKFENIKSSDYASSLLSVNASGSVNNALINAVDSIEARGATAADLGFEMAKGVFANTDSTDRQRVVVFMTDGEPTYLSGFQTSVANSAIANTATLKKAYDASIYSVGVFSKRESEDANINRFMNAVSSGYPDAQSMRYPGDGTDGLFYTTVNNTDTLSSVFKSISTEALSHTAPFDNLTVIKTLSPYVTMTSQQEEKLRVDLIREYGITNDDIIITRNTDGTTTVQVNNLTPKETTDENGKIIYEVKFEFFASLNEKAAQIGEYPVDTEDSGVMLGADAKGYEATFDMSSIELTAGKTRVIFTINGEVYEISESISNGYAVAPEFKVGEGWSFVRWDTSSKKATNGMVLDATLTKADRTVTWHTADGDIVQSYVAGDFITAPTVGENASGEIFLSWDRSVPTTMPDENLEFTAVYGEHIHNYTSEVTKKVTCISDGERTYTCTCGDSYTKVIPAIGHNYRAVTPSIEKDDAKCTFVCENCGDKYDYALDYAVVNASQKHFRVIYEFQLTDDDLNCGFQPDGTIEIKIPLSELHDSAEKATVIRTNPDGSKTVVPSRHEKGFLIITCDHFTPYEVIFDINCEEHEQDEWIVVTEPTCTEDGERYAECLNCEKEIVREVIPALGHSFTNYISNGNATCTADGTKTAKCDRCDVTNTVTDEGSAKGHTIVIDKAAAPTCTETGLTEGKHCSVCNTVLVKQEVIPATGHNDNNSDEICDNCGEDLGTHTPSENCSCNCHKSGFAGFIYKIMRFFWKLLRINQTCACGQAHY